MRIKIGANLIWKIQTASDTYVSDGESRRSASSQQTVAGSIENGPDSENPNTVSHSGVLGYMSLLMSL